MLANDNGRKICVYLFNFVKEYKRIPIEINS